MKYNTSVVATFLLAVSIPSTNAFLPLKQNGQSHVTFVRSTVVDKTTQTDVESKMDSLTYDLISKLRFREVQRELERRALDATGTLTAMKIRLREAAMGTTVSATPESSQKSRVIDTDTIDEVRN